MLCKRGTGKHVPGIFLSPAVLAFRDTVLAAETCEELFTPQAPHIDLALAGELCFDSIAIGLC